MCINGKSWNPWSWRSFNSYKGFFQFQNLVFILFGYEKSVGILFNKMFRMIKEDIVGC